MDLIFFSVLYFAILPDRIYNPIMAMGFLAMFTFQVDNTKMINS